MPTCPVCGYAKLHEAPRAPSGGGSYEICPSCGFQFGVDDDDQGLSYEQARERWITGGMKWYSKGLAKPKSWNAAKQLAGVSVAHGTKKAPRKKKAAD